MFVWNTCNSSSYLSFIMQIIYPYILWTKRILGQEIKYKKFYIYQQEIENDVLNKKMFGRYFATYILLMFFKWMITFVPTKWFVKTHNAYFFAMLGSKIWLITLNVFCLYLQKAMKQGFWGTREYLFVWDVFMFECGQHKANYVTL